MYGRVAEESAQHEAWEQQTIQKDSMQVLQEIKPGKLKAGQHKQIMDAKKRRSYPFY